MLGRFALVVMLAGTLSGSADADADRNRAKLRTMAADDVEQLFKALHSFETLSADERQRLEQLHEELTASKEQSDLEATMARYVRWLTTLTPAQRRQLDVAPEADRLRIVRDLIADQKRHLSEDLQPLLKWQESEASRPPSRFSRYSSRPGFPWGFTAVRELDNQLRKLPNLSEEDKELLESIPRESPLAGPLVVLLCDKYGVPPGEMREIGESLLRNLYDWVLRPHFKKPTVQDLTPEERAELVSLCVMLFHLPRLNGEKEMKVLEENAKMWESVRPGPFSSRVIPMALYYRDNPSEIPEPLKKKLSFLRDMAGASEDRSKVGKQSKERLPIPAELFEKMKEKAEKAGPGLRRRVP